MCGNRFPACGGASHINITVRKQKAETFKEGQNDINGIHN
jgi:hypothetical protein|tara:strand:+ start:433 stop:552 length:120 start_codon:yes stop_codon:yes gene_type:complete